MLDVDASNLALHCLKERKDEFIPKSARINFVGAKLPRNRGNFQVQRLKQAMDDVEQSALNLNSNSKCSTENSFVDLRWPRQVPVARGLHNLGNTCFANSVLQSIFHAAPFYNIMSSRSHSSGCKKTGFCLFCEMEKHAISLFNGKTKSPHSPAGILRNIKVINKQFRLGRQEDAHEFLRFTLDGLEKCSPKSSSSNKTEKISCPITRIFEGRLRNEVKCTACGYISSSLEPFMDLSLPISGSKLNSLKGALSQFSAPDILNGDNKYRCSSCKKLVVAHKRMVIHKPPPVLSIHLKRFEFSQLGGMGKVNKDLQFEPSIDISTFMGCKTDPSESSIYDLSSVVVHFGGSCRSGHYVSYVKAPNGIWHLMDDDSVTQVGLQTVLKQKAFILFYVQRPSKNSSPLRPLATSTETRISKPIPETIAIEKISESKPPQLLRFRKSQIYENSSSILLTSEASSLLWHRSYPPISSFTTSNFVYLTSPVPEISTLQNTSRPRISSEPALESWQHVDSGLLKNRAIAIRTLTPKRTQRDEWDKMLDQGRKKKIKTKSSPSPDSASNPFLKLQISRKISREL